MKCQDCLKNDAEIFTRDLSKGYCKTCRNMCCGFSCSNCVELFPLCEDCKTNIATLYQLGNEISYYCNKCRFACCDSECCDIYPIWR